MSVDCNACYLASTRPLWVAQFVTILRTDRPCPAHAAPTSPKQEQ